MKTTTIGILALGLVGGCATAPPAELVDARAEVQRASAGPAAKRAPEELARARQALASAESSFDEHPQLQRTRDLAYYAKRQAEVAESAARAAAERDRRATAQAGVMAAQKQIQERATSAEQRADAEAAARVEADRARELQAAESAEAKERAESEQRALTVQDQLRSKQLTEEQRARLVAEQQAQQEREQRALAETRHQTEVQSVEQSRSAAEAQAARANAEKDQAVERANKERSAREESEATMRRLERFASVRNEARGKIITLNGSVLFTSGTARLLPAARDRLDEVATALESERGARFTIEGFSDSRGSAQRNLKLSQARADAVRDYLIAHGVDDERIRAVGMGKVRPVASNATADGRANNRRVEIIVGHQQAER